MARQGNVPCTVLSSSLGSGKTTLLNHILKSNPCKRIAVIENKSGKVGINSAIVQSSFVFQVEEDVLEVPCLKRIKKRSVVECTPVDHIVIEATGFAELAALVQTFFADEFVAGMCFLDGILTLVDTKWLEQQLNDDRDHVVENEAEKQLAYADVILLNKADFMDREALAQIQMRIRKINPSVSIRLALHSQLDMKVILGIDAWSLHKVVDSDDGFLDCNDSQCHHLSLSGRCGDMFQHDWRASFCGPCSTRGSADCAMALASSEGTDPEKAIAPCGSKL